MLPPSPAELNPPLTGLVLSGTRVTCVVSLMDYVLFDLILTYSDRQPSLLLLALSPFPFPQVIAAVLPLPGSVSTATRAIPLPFSRLAWTLLLLIMGPRTTVKIRYTMDPQRISSFSRIAWYEWYPDSSYYFSNLDISTGNVIRATVNSSTSTSGIATIENLTNGQTGVRHLSSTSALCGRNAEWIVEDFEDGNGNQVPFANFGTVTFTDAIASGPGTGTYTPDGAIAITLEDPENDYQVLTSVSINGSSVTIEYL